MLWNCFDNNSWLWFFQPHRCHYGACPPCRLICGERYSCGHECKLRFALNTCVSVIVSCRVHCLFNSVVLNVMYRCHGPKPPPLPEFTLKPKKKKSNHLREVTPGSPCPPCPEPVLRSCLGHHIGAERMVGFLLSK